MGNVKRKIWLNNKKKLAYEVDILIIVIIYEANKPKKKTENKSEIIMKLVATATARVGIYTNGTDNVVAKNKR